MRVYIGWDWKEEDAWKVCEHSLRKHSSIPLDIRPISSAHPMMNRPFRHKGNQAYDEQDNRPFSTMFSFARFMVPIIEDYEGWAMFVDCDFLFRRDVAELFALKDDDKAVMVVQQDHVPKEKEKMDGLEQTSYRRKNWSSLILWNCEHKSHRLSGPFKGIDAQKVNTLPGVYLHGFDWLEMGEIGSLPSDWNWLEGYSHPTADPAAVHFTKGGPWLRKYEDVGYADEWRQTLKEIGADHAG